MDAVPGDSGFAEIELEQVDGIASADLVTIVLADAGAVEAVADLLFRLVLRRRLDPAVAMIDAPHAVGQAFAHMAQDDLEFGIGIEQARSHQAQRMNGGLLSEGPGRAHQPWMSFIDRAVLRQWI